jgi:hypothetical protein
MMEWKDQGIILGTKPLGESKTLVQVFSSQHGRYNGLIRLGSKLKLQSGQIVTVSWRAKLEEHVGFWQTLDVQKTQHFAHILGCGTRLLAVVTLCLICRFFLAERVAYSHFYQQAYDFLEALGREDWPLEYLALEMVLLHDLGYGVRTGDLPPLDPWFSGKGSILDKNVACPEKGVLTSKDTNHLFFAYLERIGKQLEELFPKNTRVHDHRARLISSLERYCTKGINKA